MRTSFLSKNHSRSRRTSVSLPVVLALALFIISVVSFITFSASSSAQAERILKKLYTSEKAEELEEAASVGLPRMYEEHFAGDLTDNGKDSLLPIGIPYTLYLQQLGAPVERIYAQPPELVKEEDNGKTVSYRYTVETEFYLERRLEPVAPVVRKKFIGTITLRKTGFLKWKMDAVTAG
ncbi:hypothetical protein V3C10_10085 [[Clostridium] symbiosum]|uniref:hypothetical protein n=1 Tax=Clostridium symbiosum TaxID=1512 RepID=UPI001D05D0A8|nr:hypothetical protein [[Clostridium] symbiosum]MCB6610267.1 hypothetical protein [[Clostridium] symbiosum]MCB6929443.1 hypothetical protein [[Clostridium] symbiosum]